jgi:hypothetical protein
MKTSVDFSFNPANYNISVIGQNPYSGSNIMMGSAFYITTGSLSYVSADRYAQITGYYFNKQSGNYDVIEWSSRFNWIFFLQAESSEHLGMAVHDKYTNTCQFHSGCVNMNWGLSLTNPFAFKMLYYKYTDGTVTVSGTNLIGTGTDFTSGRISAGSRIGLGSQTPENVTAWSDIKSINNASGMTLYTNLGTSIASGSAYVIENLWAVRTAGRSGLMDLVVAKGLSFNLFSGSVAVTHGIYADTGLDNQRNLYFLTTPAYINGYPGSGSCAAFEPSSAITSGSHYFYVVTCNNARDRTFCFKFNIRGNLSGPGLYVNTSYNKTDGAYVAMTGHYNFVNTTTVLSGSQLVNNGLIISYGATGSKSLIFVGNSITAKATKIFRSDTRDIVSGSTGWITDFANEFPPLGGQLVPLSTNIGQLAYLPKINRFICSYNTTPWGCYVLQYDAKGITFDNYALPCRGVQISGPYNIVLSSGTRSGLPTMPSGAYSFQAAGDWLYIMPNTHGEGQVRDSQTILTQTYSCDWNYTDTTQQYVITPKIPTPNASKLYRVYVMDQNQADTDSTTDGVPPEPYQIEIRTSGMDDNTGIWTVLDDASDLSGISPGDYIQFRLSFRVFGPTMRINRIYGINITYEKYVQDSHYEPSPKYSDLPNYRIAWKQMQLWGSSIPDLTVYLSRETIDNANETILTDSVSGSRYGVWQYSTNGTTWNAWDASQDALGNLIRYTADIWPSGMNYTAILKQT